MGWQRAQLETFTSAPPEKRRRSVVLGCLGLLVAAPSGLFVILAVVDVATGAENVSGAIVAGICLSMIAVAGAAAALFGFSKKVVPSKPDFEDAKAVREAFFAVADTSDPVSRKINAAAGLLLDGRYEESIQAYTALAQEHPDQRRAAYSQIGAACYFLGRYEEAIGWYEQALAHGADPKDMHDNIEEAREALG